MRTGRRETPTSRRPVTESFLGRRFVEPRASPYPPEVLPRLAETLPPDGVEVPVGPDVPTAVDERRRRNCPLADIVHVQ